jgi:hypothetical protein
VRAHAGVCARARAWFVSAEIRTSWFVIPVVFNDSKPSLRVRIVCMCARAHVSACACVRACVRACVFLCVHACAYGCAELQTFSVLHGASEGDSFCRKIPNWLRCPERIYFFLMCASCSIPVLSPTQQWRSVGYTKIIADIRNISQFPEDITSIL